MNTSAAKDEGFFYDGKKLYQIRLNLTLVKELPKDLFYSIYCPLFLITVKVSYL